MAVFIDDFFEGGRCSSSDERDEEDAEAEDAGNEAEAVRQDEEAVHVERDNGGTAGMGRAVETSSGDEE